MDPRPPAAVAAVPLVLVPALGAVQGGYQPDAWVWAGALAAWACALALALTSSPGALRRAWPWAAASLGLLVWTLASASWSVESAQSILEARRMLVYAAAVAALLLLARAASTQVLALATHTAIVALLVYALGRYLSVTRTRDPFEAFQISQPLGYANAVGVLAATAIVLAVGIASESGSRPLRSWAGATVPPLTLVLYLSGSTASWLALGAGIVIVALLCTGGRRFIVTLVAVAPPAAVAAVVGAYSEYSANVETTRLGGAAVAAIALATAAAAAAAVRVLESASARLPSKRPRGLAIVALACILLAGAAAFARTGSTEPRASYWHVAWHEYRAHPALGSGAGTFGVYWARSGKTATLQGALDAHSLYLETLAELGPVGLVLLLAFLLAPLRGVIARRRSPYVATALGAYAVFLVHAALDWDWEMPAVVVAALCCAAAVATADLRQAAPLPRSWRIAMLATAFVLGGCAIAGARSNTLPGTQKAPRSGAFVHTLGERANYFP